jgi:hypothetical protein
MPPKVGSRYANTYAFHDEHGRFVLSEREPFLYRELADNRVHTVADGDTWWGLADRYFQPLPRACGFWWALCDFQPEAVIDPTIELEVGLRVIIPSLRTLTDLILADRSGGAR